MLYVVKVPSGIKLGNPSNVPSEPSLSAILITEIESIGASMDGDEIEARLSLFQVGRES